MIALIVHYHLVRDQLERWARITRERPLDVLELLVARLFEALAAAAYRLALSI